MARKTAVPPIPATGEERRTAREALGLTQWEVGISCGVREHTVRLWERGVMPSGVRAELYAQVLAGLL